AWMRSQERKYSTAVDAFLLAYPGYVSAAANRLGSMFKPSDYPSVEELEKKFGMEMRVMPVPSSEDFRVSMSEAQADRIKADIERHVAEATLDAVKDVYRRVAEVTGRMAER